MKKLVLALTAVAAFSGSASAADLAARPYAKAPIAPMAPAYNWTGFYIFGGAGGGLWNADSNVQAFPGAVALTRDQRVGGDGWFGTVGVGYDWQFNGPWVVGIFGDGQFGSLKGSLSDPSFGIEGQREAPHQLCSRRSPRLPGCAERFFLRQRRLLRFGMVRHEPLDPRSGRRSDPGDHRLLPSQRLVCRRRRRKQPELLRHQRAGLVPEDRIPLGLLRPHRAAGNRCRWWSDRCGRHLQALGADHQHLAGLPLQLGWPGRREVLISATRQLKSPGIVRGFFVR